MKRCLPFLIITWSCVSLAAPSDPMTLQAALSQAYSANPDIAAAQARYDAEHSAIRSESFLDDPKIGFMRENNMNFMEMVQGPMNTWSISQSVKFPAKYFLLNRAQSAKASASDEMAKAKRLEVRTNVIGNYYGYFASTRILQLLTAQREALREIARIAEARYATGAVPQQDEMKAHVEQTEIEKDILVAEQEQSADQAMLNSALGMEGNDTIVLPKEDLSPPHLTANFEGLAQMVEHHSEHIREAKANLDEANARKSLAYYSYAPDFSLNYRRAFGSYANQNSYAASIELSIPLWFFAKQSGEVASATARAIEAEKELDAAKLHHMADVKALSAKVQSSQKILEIYRTGLIPQATGTLNSSRAAYRAGRTSFGDLLDSERSLYNLQIAYYRTLAQYAQDLAKLEETVGQSASTLPFGDQE